MLGQRAGGGFLFANGGVSLYCALRADTAGPVWAQRVRPRPGLHSGVLLSKGWSGQLLPGSRSCGLLAVLAGARGNTWGVARCPGFAFKHLHKHLIDRILNSEYQLGLLKTVMNLGAILGPQEFSLMGTRVCISSGGAVLSYFLLVPSHSEALFSS